MGSSIQNKKEMIMHKFFKIIPWLFIPAPLVYIIITWSNLTQQVAIHFNLNGEPDRFGNRNDLLLLVLLITMLNMATYLLLRNIHHMAPRWNSPSNKPLFDRMAFAISLFISIILFIIIRGAIKQDMISGMRFIFAGTGLLLCFTGNYMHTIKPNYFAGIRLPWTLGNEDNWRKTHLLGGKLFFAGGLLIAIACLIVPAEISPFIFGIITAILILWLCVYSYRLHKTTKHNS
jgi:uncharacterized membrane protein